jgi:hypothetical protein
VRLSSSMRVGWGKLLDGHIEKGLILSGLFFANPGTPLVEPLIPFEEEDHLGIIGNFLGKLRMFSEIPIKLHPQQAVSCFENTQGNPPFTGLELPWFRN